jgi:predicted deacetylase
MAPLFVVQRSAPARLRLRTADASLAAVGFQGMRKSTVMPDA